MFRGFVQKNSCIVCAILLLITQCTMAVPEGTKYICEQSVSDLFPKSMRCTHVFIKTSSKTSFREFLSLPKSDPMYRSKILPVVLPEEGLAESAFKEMVRLAKHYSLTGVMFNVEPFNEKSSVYNYSIKYLLPEGLEVYIFSAPMVINSPFNSSIVTKKLGKAILNKELVNIIIEMDKDLDQVNALIQDGVVLGEMQSSWDKQIEEWTNEGFPASRLIVNIRAHIPTFYANGVSVAKEVKSSIQFMEFPRYCDENNNAQFNITKTNELREVKCSKDLCVVMETQTLHQNKADFLRGKRIGGFIITEYGESVSSYHGECLQESLSFASLYFSVNL